MTNSNNPANNTVDVNVLKGILVNLVTVPDDVKITREIDELGVLVSVSVNAQDMGLVIGRNGGMAKAIKTVMTAIGMAHKMRIRVQFLEPDGSSKYGGGAVSPKPNGQKFGINDKGEEESTNFDEFALN